jgi:hypothetical protein
VINVGKWRWPIIMMLPLVIAAVLVLSGIVRFVYEGRAILRYSGESSQIENELNLFRASPTKPMSFEKVPGQPLAISILAQANRSSDVVSKLQSTAEACVAQSLAKHRQVLDDLHEGYRKQATDLEDQYIRLSEERKVLLAGPRRNTARAQIVSKIEELKTRRRALIDQYPNHADIPILAKRIKELASQLDKPSRPTAVRITDMDRQINEVELRRSYFSRQMKETEKDLQSLQPAWRMIQPIQKPVWPHEVDRWPLGLGSMVGVWLLALIGFSQERRRVTDFQGPVSNVLPMASDVERPKAEDPVALEVVSPDLPSDPLTEKAADLYAKWVDVTKTLYTPAPEPPQGVLDRVGPLLQESTDFLPEGHDVLARYLARVVTSGDLAAHVARTVLMTLTGAQEAGVSPEHRLAMALAALFHDLAVVSRPAAIQEEVGSEVGRLSASVLSRIPGLTPALLSMVEDILVGMDEYKLETWQNVAQGLTLEPLSKVLREIDRFEKVLQKQKARLDRRIANQ